jgi:DNA-directed RNA polymerase specialized sigma24 family protein
MFTDEDLYQECMIVLIEHMHKCQSREELMRFQTMDLVNAMTRFVLKNQAVWLDCNRTDRVKKTLNSLETTVCFDKLSLASSDEDQDLIIDLDRFMSGLKQKEREIMEMKKAGYSDSSIARIRKDITSQAVGQLVRRTHKAFKKYMNEPIPA